MKTKIIIVLALILGLSALNGHAQNQKISQRHFLNFGPQFNYNPEKRLMLLGGGVGYEYRINRHWGLTANANFNMGIEDKSVASFMPYYADRSTVQLINIANSNVSIGARYYLNRFYFNASFGYGEERQQLKFSDSRGTRWESERSFYQAYGMGYQIPLKQNSLEIFASAGGTRDLVFTTGLRLNLGLSKNK